MKTLISIALIFAFQFQCVAQDKLRKITTNCKNPAFTETYHVLKSNPEVKQGAYKKEFSRTMEKGFFENNEKVGTWEYYSFGKLIQKYNYSTEEIEFYDDSDIGSKFYQVEGDSLIEIMPDIKPIFIGGNFKLLTYGGGLKYPRDAQRRGIQGKTYTTVTITSDGKMIDETINSNIGGGCEEESLRVLKAAPDNWVPAKLNGEPVTVRFDLSIVFKFSN